MNRCRTAFIAAIIQGVSGAWSYATDVPGPVSLPDHFNRLVNSKSLGDEPNGHAALLLAVTEYKTLVAEVAPRLKTSPPTISTYDSRVFPSTGPSAATNWDDTGLILNSLLMEDVLRSLDALAAAKMSEYPKASSPVGMTMADQFGRFRELARLCLARMRAEWLAGREEQAVRSLEHVLGIARVMAGSMQTPARSSARLEVARALQVLRGCLAERHAQPRTYASAIAVIDRQCDWSNDLSYLRVQRIAALDQYGWSRTEKGDKEWQEVKGVSQAIAEATGLASLREKLEAGRAPDPHAASVDERDASQTVLETGRAFDDLDRAARMIPLDRYNGGWRAADQVKRLGKQDSPLVLMWGTSVRSVYDRDELRATVLGTRLVVRIEGLRAVDKLPETLADAGLEQEIDPITDKAWRYRKFGPGEDSASRPYTLYSPGLDGKDDGGSLGPEGERCAGAISDWQGRRTCDFVVNDAVKLAVRRPE